VKVKLTRKVSGYAINGLRYKPGDVFNVPPEMFCGDFMQNLEAKLKEKPRKEEPKVEEKPAKKTKKKKVEETVVEEAEPELEKHLPVSDEASTPNGF